MIRYREIVKILLIFTVAVLLLKRPLQVFGSQCELRLTYPPNYSLVIAEVIDQDESRFKTILVLRGKVDPEFTLVRLPPAVGIPPWPRFRDGERYLLSLTPQLPTLPSCDRIVTKVTGPYDPRVLLSLGKIISKPFWTGGFIGVIFVSLTLDKFHIPPLLSWIIAVLIVGGVYLAVLAILIKVVARLLSKLKGSKKQ